VTVRNAEYGERSSGMLPFIEVSYEKAWGRVSLADRSRLDELSGIAGSPKRYRNRLSVDWSLGLSLRPSDLIAADEVFYEWSTARWSINSALTHFTGED
jgi:hypothetical protein